MPLFDFVCRNCGNEFETLVLGSETPFCPECKSGDLAKQMSTFATRTRGKSEGSGTSGSKCSGCAAKSCSTCH